MWYNFRVMGVHLIFTRKNHLTKTQPIGYDLLHIALKGTTRRGGRAGQGSDDVGITNEKL